jgi:apolipoprotein D and lipocalin family protein
MCVLAATGCTSTTKNDVVPLADVDLERMYGGWYIVATIPNLMERGFVGPYDVYSPGAPGTIREDFTMRRGGFGARERHYVVRIDVLPNRQNADWKVRLFWPVRLPFQIFYVDPQYRYVLFGEQNRNLGWVYSRTRDIAEEDYQALLTRFTALGYDSTRFRRVIQMPEQIGQPGFWSDGVER